MNKSILLVVLLGAFLCLIQENNADSMVDIAKAGFAICNADGQPGLTWDEVEACEVSINNFTQNW